MAAASNGGGVTPDQAVTIGSIIGDVVSPFLGAEVGALIAHVGVEDMKVEVETLSTFKAKVDAMLADLDKSDASHTNIAEQQLSPGHLGAGFGEAIDLLNAYNVVHLNLQTLSQTLANQIEAMSIAIDISAKGYQNVDESQRDALWKIRNETDTQYKTPPSPSGVVAGPGGVPGGYPNPGTQPGAATPAGGSTPPPTNGANSANF